MSKIKSTLGAAFLTVVLAVPALGGVIGSPGGTEPPPPPPPPVAEESSSPGPLVPGEMSSPGVVSPTLVDILMAVLFLI